MGKAFGTILARPDIIAAMRAALLDLLVGLLKCLLVLALVGLAMAGGFFGICLARSETAEATVLAGYLLIATSIVTSVATYALGEHWCGTDE
jgi:hypothetical protein